MGLFGGKKTYVASTCYNLAGDEAERPNFLKSAVLATTLAPGNRSMGDGLRESYINGPGIKMRGFYRWAEDNYNSVVGLSASGLAGSPDIDPDVVASYVPEGASSVVMQMVRSNPADYEVWAEQWVLNNHPTQINTPWTSDYDDDTGQITVTLAGGSTHTFTPANFQKDALYIYAAYNVVTEDGTGAVTDTGVVTLAPEEDFPSTAGWDTLSFSSTAHPGPPAWTETHGVYTRTDFMGSDGTGRIYSLKKTMSQDQTGPEERSYSIQTVELIEKAWSPLRIFIYRVGSGIAALDAQVNTSIAVGGFFPPIPVRLDNKFISPTYLPGQYDAAKRAYKKLTGGGKFDDLVAKLAENEDLPDIDFVFVVPGVALNVKENSSRRYLYEFFYHAMTTSLYGETAYNSWASGVGSVAGSMTNWEAWLNAQGGGGPLDGAPEPSRGSYGSAPRNEIRIRSTISTLGYDTRISWKSIKEETGGGLAKAGAQVGEVWLAKGDTFQEVGPSYSGLVGLITSLDAKSEDLLIYWQVSATSWKRLVIRGLVHQNYVYNGKFVEIKAHEALDDVDESGFIVPIHYDTWRSMSIKDTTQMTTASIFLVLNSYKVKKKKWYQTGIFKIVLVIAAIVLSIYFPPAGLVGASAMTIAAVTLTNIVLGIILYEVINTAAIAIFGKRLGGLIAAVATFLVMNPAAFLDPNGAMNLTNLMRPENLLGLTQAVGRGVTSWIQADILETLQKTQDILEQYSAEAKQIAQMFQDNLGYGQAFFDPMSLTNASNPFNFVVEPGSVFLARTLMTGSDIAELSQSLLSDFASLTLSTDLQL